MLRIVSLRKPCISPPLRRNVWSVRHSKQSAALFSAFGFGHLQRVNSLASTLTPCILPALTHRGQSAALRSLADCSHTVGMLRIVSLRKPCISPPLRRNVWSVRHSKQSAALFSAFGFGHLQRVNSLASALTPCILPALAHRNPNDLKVLKVVRVRSAACTIRLHHPPNIYPSQPHFSPPLPHLRQPLPTRRLRCPPRLRHPFRRASVCPSERDILRFFNY